MIVRRLNSPTRCAATGAPTGFSPCSPGRGNDPDDGVREHRPIASEAGDELLQNLTDQPCTVVIGLKLAAHPGFGTIDIPMIFIPVIHDCEVARA